MLDCVRPDDTLAVTRPPRELLEIVETLEAQEINLIGLVEEIDTTSAASELVFHVIAAIAIFARRLISGRTKDGLLAARKHGRTLSRPPLHAMAVSALQELVDNGIPVAKAARHFGTGRLTADRLIRDTSP